MSLLISCRIPGGFVGHHCRFKASLFSEGGAILRQQVMKNFIKISGLLALSALSSSAVIVWSPDPFGTLDAFDEANWDLTGSSVTAVDPNVSIDDDIMIAGNVEIPNLGGQVRLQIGDGFTMTIDGGTLGLVGGGNDGTGGAPGSAGVNINLINGGQLNTFFIVNAVDLSIDGTSSATFGGGGNPVNLSTVDLTSGAVLTFLAETPTQFTAEHLSKVTVDGVAAADGVNIMIEPFNGTSGSRITVIPEPSSSLLMGLGGMALLLRRRK